MKTIRQGSRGADVATLQKKLNLNADGIFGPKTEEAVKLFQKANGLSVDGIVGAKTWSALGYETADEITPSGRKITKLILHCSATPEGEDFTIDSIDAAHKARKFSYYIDPVDGKKRYIGYHYIIKRDGTIVRCRPENIRGCHVSNHNYDSIGVCYIGGCPPRSDKDWNRKGKDTRTHAQKVAIIKLCNELKSRYPGASIHGHNEFANKACPSFIVKNDPELNRL